eukprot:298396-Prorocentrum_minimum.AAC.3
MRPPSPPHHRGSSTCRRGPPRGGAARGRGAAPLPLPPGIGIGVDLGRGGGGGALEGVRRLEYDEGGAGARLRRRRRWEVGQFVKGKGGGDGGVGVRRRSPLREEGAHRDARALRSCRRGSVTMSTRSIEFGRSQSSLDAGSRVWTRLAEFRREPQNTRLRRLSLQRRARGKGSASDPAHDYSSR